MCRPGRPTPAVTGPKIGTRVDPRVDAGAGCLLAGPSRGRAPHPDLTIGVASFPSTLHPAIDPEVIKVYVLELADRPVTAFDANGQLVCLLCTELPSIANGGARLEDLPGGGQGHGRDFPLPAGSAMGRRRATGGGRSRLYRPRWPRSRTAASAIPTPGPSSAASTWWTRKPR